MKTNKLRKTFLNNPQKVRGILLTDYQMSILDLISNNEGDSDSKWLMSVLSISITNATTQLRKLWEKGYLTRVETKDPTGGILYKYSTVYKKNES